MKELTPQELRALTLSIFVRYNMQGNFKVLRDFSNEPFTSLETAKEHLQKHYFYLTWEISTFEQAVNDNGMIDNI